MIKVRISAGPQTGRVFDLIEGQNFIGRQEGNQLTLPSTQVSRRHACLTVADGRVFLEDLQSANGTYVNGARIQKVELRHGSKIQLGEFHLDVLFAGAPGAMPSGPMPGQGPMPPQPQGPMPSGPVPQGAPSMPQGVPMAQGRPSMPQMPGMPAQAASQGGAYPSMGAPPADGLFWKIYTPLARIPLRVQVIVLMLVLAGAITGAVIKPLLESKREAVSQEAIKRASTLVTSLAMKNGEFVKTQNETNYDTASYLQNEGVTEALLLSTKGTVLHPPSQRGRDRRNALVIQVQNARDKDVVILEEPEVNNVEGKEGTYHLAAPIRVWNNDSARYEVLGFAYLVFRAAEVGSAATAMTVTLVLYGGLVTLLAVIFGLVVVSLHARSIQALKEDAEFNLRGEGQAVASRVRHSELEDLARTLNRALERAARGAEAPGGHAGAAMAAPARPGDDMTEAKVEAVARAVPDAVLVLDEMQRVVFVNAMMERWLGRTNAQAKGQHLTAVMVHPQLVGGALELLREIAASRQPVLARDVYMEAERRQAQVVASGALGPMGELKYGAVVIR